MKLQPCVQSFVVHRANQKSGFKYFGPYPVLQRVGSMTYKLQLPTSSAIHPMVHVSQPKLATGFKGQVSLELPSDLMQFSIPLQIVSTRTMTHGDHQVVQVLIKWSELPEDLATWEDYEVLKQSFLSTAATPQEMIHPRPKSPR
jgi:hypothetical protein